MTTLTAKHFQEPLLQALGTLTNFVAGVAVSGEDTYAPVMTLMGIPDINHLGNEASSGQPLVPRLIQWACKNLRKTGEVDLQGRGQWALTPMGASDARSLVPMTTPDPAPVVAVAPPQARPAVLSRGPLNDPYILNLLLEQTPCLGNYTPHLRAECASCTVTPECKNKLYGRYSQVAAKFATLDSLSTNFSTPTPTPNVATPVASTPSVVPVAAPVAAPVVIRPSTFDRSTAQEIKCFEEMICSDCGKPIVKGPKCYWIEDLVQQTTFMIHIECPEDI